MVTPSAAAGSDGGVVIDWSCDAVTRGRCCCCLTVNSQSSWNGSWCGSVAAVVVVAGDGGNGSRAMGVSLASVMTVPLLT